MANLEKLGLGPIIKNLPRVIRHPRTAANLLAFEAQKTLLGHFRLSAKSGVAGKIRVVTLRPTDLCNLRCRVCGQWGESGYQFKKDIKHFKEQELPVSRYRFLLEDLVRSGHRPIVVVLGGEPMLYRKTMDLIEAAASLGLPTMMTTNGTGIPAIAARLVKAPLFGLQFSIDGHCSELHNKLRPSPAGADNFAQIESSLKAVRLARNDHGPGLPLISGITVISRENSGKLLDIYETFQDDLDLFIFCLSWWSNAERARQHAIDFQKRFGYAANRQWGYLNTQKPNNYAELNEHLRELFRRSRHWGAKPVSLIPLITGVDNLRDYYTRHHLRFGYERCVSIFQEVHIMSNGDVSPCRSYADYRVGNVKETTITELWNCQAYVDFRRSLNTKGLMPACTRCCGLMGC